jgi:hypothetical protein
MEVICQLHFPAALLLRNSTLYPVTRKLDRTHIVSYLFVYLFIYFREKSLPTPTNRTTTHRSSNPWRGHYTEYPISAHFPQLILVAAVVVVPWCCLPIVRVLF